VCVCVEKETENHRIFNNSFYSHNCLFPTGNKRARFIGGAGNHKLYLYEAHAFIYCRLRVSVGYFCSREGSYTIY